MAKRSTLDRVSRPKKGAQLKHISNMQKGISRGIKKYVKPSNVGRPKAPRGR